MPTFQLYGAQNPCNEQNNDCMIFLKPGILWHSNSDILQLGNKYC